MKIFIHEILDAKLLISSVHIYFISLYTWIKMMQTPSQSLYLLFISAFTSVLPCATRSVPMCCSFSAVVGNLLGLVEWCRLMLLLMLYWLCFGQAALWTAVTDPVVWGIRFSASQTAVCVVRSFVVVRIIGQSTEVWRNTTTEIKSAESFPQWHF